MKRSEGSDSANYDGCSDGGVRMCARSPISQSTHRYLTSVRLAANAGCQPK
jgi:hypothetical protein